MTVSGKYVPERGDAIWIASSSRDSQGPAGRNAALVLSPSAYNGKVGRALLCPITGLVKGYPFEVPVPARMRVSGAILSDQVNSLDWRTLEPELICKIPEVTVLEVLRKASALLSK